jgi:hypothetical protein
MWILHGRPKKINEEFENMMQNDNIIIWNLIIMDVNIT